MSEIIISTDGLKTTRLARIDGALYEIRRIGAGDQLDISQLGKKLVAESRKAMDLREKMQTESKEKQTEMLDEVNVALETVAEAQNALEKCYARLFTAKDDGANPDNLVRTVGVEGIHKIIDQVFSAKDEGKDDGGN